MNEIFILTTGSIERLGGMERFLQYVACGFRERGYSVRVFHSGNNLPGRPRDNKVSGVARSLDSSVQGYYVGRAARRALHPGVRLVLSNSTVGWYPLGRHVKHAHFFHGTYCGQAEAIRPFITYRGYLKLKWWDGMILERFSGSKRIALCCSELIRSEIRCFFGYDAKVLWYPIDLNHFRRLDRTECRRRLGIDTEAVGLYVGSAHPMKGFSVVEHVARTFPKLTMLLAVRGPVPESVNLLPNVRLYKDADYNLLPTLYNAADFSLCPSRYDPFPFVVSEALASGTPVIATPHGASLTFYTDPISKLLLADSADDYDGFDTVVRRLLSNPDRWRTQIEVNVRPRLEEMMSPGKWWNRFLQTVEI